MKPKSALIVSLIVTGCLLATVTIHWSRIESHLPGHCYHCGYPGVFKTGESNAVVPASKWHKCVFCGERYHQLEVDQVAGNDVPWVALLMEWAGQTDSGPVHAGQTLPDTGAKIATVGNN